MAIILGRKPGGAGGGGAPSGPAGGDLTGTYPNPTLAAASVDAAAIDGGDAAAILTDLGVSAFVQTVLNDATAAAAATTLAVTPNDGWIDDSAATWTRTANQTFTVTGDRTTVFTKGTRLRWTQTTVKYGTVIASSHAAGTTTVTIATTTDYVLTAAAISVNSYSYAANPQGYPSTFAHSPIYTGFSADPSGGTSHFSIVGSTCTYIHARSDGTSNATGFTLTLPVTALLAIQTASVRCINNGASQTGVGLAVIGAGSATLDVFLTAAAGAWTNTNGKNGFFIFTYFI